MRLTIAKLHPQKILILLASAILASCVGAVQMFPTVTPTPGLTIEPTNTPSPLPTSTPTSTATPEPTATETLEPTQISALIATTSVPLRLGTIQTIAEAGFAYRPIVGYEERYQENQVTLTSIDGDTVLSFIGGQKVNTEDLESIIENFSEILSDSFFEEFNVSDAYPVSIDNSPGLAVEVDGMWGENPIAGRIVVVSPADNLAFYALAFSSSVSSGEGWEPEGRQAFEAVIQSVKFLDPVDSH
jgi:hypothetical protein